MMPPERTDQPSRVSTAEIPRAPDEHVTTSDLDPPGGQGPTHPGDSERPARAAATPPGAGAEPPEPAAGDDEGQPQKPRRQRDRATERRFARLTAKLAEAEARDAEREHRLAELEALVAKATPAPTPPPKPKEPKLADFPTPQEYAVAYAAWKQGATEPTPRAPRAAPIERAAEPPPPAAKKGPTDKELNDFQARGKARLGDEFMAALEEGTPTNQLMAEFMFDSDVGPDVYVHLVNNPELARRIYDSSIPRATAALEDLAKKAKAGELDLELESAPLYDADERSDSEDPDRRDPAPPPRRAARESRAPTPPSDTRPGNAPAGRPNPERMNMDDYAQMRLRDIARKQGRILQ